MSDQPWSTSSTAADGRRRSIDRGTNGQSASSFGSSLHVVESWRRTVLPLAQLQPSTALATHNASAQAAAASHSVGYASDAAVVAGGDRPAWPGPSSSARSGLGPSPLPREPAVDIGSSAGQAYPASDPLGFFVKRPVQALARAAVPERTLSLSSTGSAHAPVSTLTRTPSLSEASSYTGDHHGWHGPNRNGTTASSDHCPASPTGLPFGFDLGATLSLSSGPSPTSSPSALRPEDDSAHAPPPPVSLLSALLASHSHHTKALAQQQPSSGVSSAHPPSSAFASPASSMPNSTASSPLGGSIHPHLAQSARQRRFSSGACDMLENVGEEGETEEPEATAGSVQGGQQVLEPLALEHPKPLLATDPSIRWPFQAPKARIGIPSAKPPSIFLAASPAPSLITPSATNSVRKPSIVFIDDPEIAAKRGITESSSATTPATSDAATDSSINMLLSTPEASPAPSARDSPARLQAPAAAATANSFAAAPPVRRGLSFAEPPKLSLASPPPTPRHPPAVEARPPTPTRKVSGLTFAVTAVCARPKALGPEKAVGTLDEDEEAELEDDGAGSDNDDDDDDDDEEDDDEDDDDSEDDDEDDGLDAVDEEEADGYEEDDEGEGSDDLELGEREGARYRYRREALFGQDSDDDSASVGSEEDETASIRTKTSGRGSVISNFSGFSALAPNEDGEDLSSTYRQGSLQHRRSSSLRGRTAWTRHSPTLPPIDAAAADSASPLALPVAATADAAPKRRRQLFSFIRRRDGGKIPAYSPHHAPRLLANGVTGLGAQPARVSETGGTLSDLPSADEPPEHPCRDDFLPSHLKSEEGKQKEREAELRELLSSTDGGGAGDEKRHGRCSRHRSPPPSSSGRDRSRDRSPAPAHRRSKKARSRKVPIPASFGALDRPLLDAYASDTLRPTAPQMHVSDSGARPTSSPAGSKARRRSYNHGSTCRPKVGGKATPPVFLSEAETAGSPGLLRIKSRPIPTPSRRMVDDHWDGDDGGFP